MNAKLDTTVGGLLREKLLNAKLYDEAQRFNIPHVTVLHIHNADPTTPEKMLKALPKLPPALNVTLKTFYTTEAAKGAGHPWWLDLGIVKEGASFEAMMAFNTIATAALTPLRDGPLPRVTGPVYAVMSDAGKTLVQTVGVSGLNTVNDGKELRPHNPHNTMVYSMAKFTPEVQGAFNRRRDGVQSDPSRWDTANLQDRLDRRTGFCGQRAARNLSHQPRGWVRAQRGNRSQGSEVMEISAGAGAGKEEPLRSFLKAAGANCLPTRRCGPPISASSVALGWRIS